MTMCENILESSLRLIYVLLSQKEQNFNSQIFIIIIFLILNFKEWIATK